MKKLEEIFDALNIETHRILLEWDNANTLLEKLHFKELHDRKLVEMTKVLNQMEENNMK